MSSQQIQSSQFLPGSLRAFIIAISYWVLSVPVSTVNGSAAAFIGSLLACYAIDTGIRRYPLRDMRLPAIAMSALLILVAAVLLSNTLKQSQLLVSILGPMLSFEAGEVILWLSIAALSAALMRTLAYRSSYGRVVEILFVACAFVITLSAHRQGMIHRPFFIGDFALVRGIDPSSILLAIGCAAVLSMAALLVMEKNHRRLPYHFMVLGLLCFSLIIYIQLFGLPTPRVTDDLGLTGQAGAGGSSQNENPFNDGANSNNDREAPVAIVLFRDDYEPESGAYYFRESAYSQFNGKVLGIASRDDLDRDLVEHFTSSRVDVSEPLPAQGLRQSVRTTIGLLTAHKSPFGLDTPVAYANAPNPNNLRFKQTYDAWSQVPQFQFPDLIDKKPGSANWTLSQWQEYLEMPDDPRYEELANTLLQDLRPEFAEDPYAKALVIKAYLDEKGIYSLKNAHAYEADPAASFLFGDMTGYCMHFAFAATYMYRSIGIPARVGIGYSVPASNRAGGSALLVQAIHGHAWPEIYLQDVGWVIVDPAPSRTLVDMSVDPQNSLQQLLGDMLRDEAAFQEFLNEQQTSWLPLATLLRVLLVLLAAVIVLAYLIKVYRLRLPYHARAEQLYRVVYRAALDSLAALGLRRNYGESREAFAHRISTLAPSFSEMTRSHLHYAMRPASATAMQKSAQLAATSTDDRQQWILLNARVKQELQHKLPLWRRLLAIIDPFSWLRTH